MSPSPDPFDALRAAVADRRIASAHKETVLDALLRAAAEVADAEAAGLYLLDKATGELVFEAVLGGGGDALEHHRMPMTQGIPGLVVSTQQPMIVEDDPQVARLTAYTPRHVLCIPLLADEERVVGALALYNSAPERRFTPEHLRLVLAFGHLAVRTIEEVAIHESFEGLLGTVGAAREGRALDEGTRIASDLGRLVAAVARRGEAERALAVEILSALERYFDGKEGPS